MGCCNLVCVECLDMIKQGGSFLFYWESMLLYVMGVGIENTCTA